MANIVVNATALTIGGGYVILKQFIYQASQNKSNSYIIFISPRLDLLGSDNISYIKVNTKGWLRRIYWDCYGLKNKLHKLGVKFDKLISLQNTSVNIRCEQIIYLHQVIPFTKMRIKYNSLMNIKLNLYKYFYSYFIFLFVKENTKFIVQTYWLKNVLVFLKKINPNNIHVIKPEFSLINNIVNNNYIDKNIFLYPASPLSYKNHTVLLEAFYILKLQGRLNDGKLAVTFRFGDFKIFDILVEKLKLKDNILYLGVLPYESLMKEYCLCKSVVFPSYIESYGLPLLEAAYLGKKIICSDLPFSREVLDGYSGATYVQYDKADDWAKAIDAELDSASKKYEKFILSNNHFTWDYFLFNHSD